MMGSTVEPEAPDTEQGQAGADPITPVVEQLPAADPVGPTMEEPLAVGPTSPGGGAHDEGDLVDMLGYEEVWAMVGTQLILPEQGRRPWRMRQVAPHRIHPRLPNKQRPRRHR